ncbi:hypothetical protein MMC07_003435 [Pseudocyphellaria aurata]|nr:hypothetical protein [Pseudocyphellaria aurata]
MRYSSRITDVARHATVSLKPRSTYVCHQCRRIALASARRTRTRDLAPPPVTYVQRRFVADDWTNKLRQKIWGTTNPPGQKDPYRRETDEERDRAVTEPQEAPPEEAKAATGEYVPALTWDDLDQIGGQDDSWEKAWTENHPFEGFMAPTKMESREDISGAIHRAMVEVFTLKEAEVRMEISIGYGETPETDYRKDVSFKQAENGNSILVFSYEQLREEVLDSLTEVEEVQNDSETTFESTVDEHHVSDREEVDLTGNNSTVRAETEAATSGDTGIFEETDFKDHESDETGEAIDETPSNDETWLDVSFSDRETKFAIIKRVMQLTGVRIPDSSIDNLNSAKALFGFLVKKPKPKKLAHSLIADENLQALRNVKIIDRRYTPIDKEKQVGRWKVIEEELTRQGLPVTESR